MLAQETDDEATALLTSKTFIHSRLRRTRTAANGRGRRSSRRRLAAVGAAAAAALTGAQMAAAVSPPVPVPTVPPVTTGPAPPAGGPAPGVPAGTTNPSPAPAPTTPPPKPALPRLIWGIGEQHAVFFGDPRWKQLPLRNVRYFVPWDLKNEPRFVRLADRWLAAARRKHATPLIAMTQSNVRGRSHYLPAGGEYRRAVGWIMHRYRWVTEWTPWNEANLSLQATLARPGRPVLYWRVMRGLCRRCTVTSPSIVGYTHNAPRGWMRRFLGAARGLHGPWAIHLYNDINEFHTYALTQLMRQLPSGPIWVTEVGAWKHFANFPTNLARQSRAIRYLFQLAPRALPRVVRWYLYQWIGSPRGFRWDSGLINPNGSARPALRVVQRFLLPAGASAIR